MGQRWGTATHTHRHTNTTSLLLSTSPINSKLSRFPHSLSSLAYYHRGHYHHHHHHQSGLEVVIALIKGFHAFVRVVEEREEGRWQKRWVKPAVTCNYATQKNILNRLVIPREPRNLMKTNMSGELTILSLDCTVQHRTLRLLKKKDNKYNIPRGEWTRTK